MANTYTQIIVQIVFAVQGREHLIAEKYRVQLEKYICGIIGNHKSKPLAIYCNPDHCHVLTGLHPDISVSKMAREIKSNSSKWINQNKFFIGRFSWQEGYGAFTYSRSQLDSVIQYIRNQPEHHRKKPFQDEYIDFLKKFGIEYDGKYIFKK